MKALLVLVLGGVLEFIGCQILVVSYNFGSQAHINDGITSSLILFSSVFILLLSYLIYRDTINVLQSAGLAVILLGVLIISVFKGPEGEGTNHQEFGMSSKILPMGGPGEGDTSIIMSQEVAKTLCIATGKYLRLYKSWHPLLYDNFTHLSN